MPEPKVFNLLMLLARPAAGKSEIIDFLKNTPIDDRINRFHIGYIYELDDFPMLWTWFEKDTLLQNMEKPRLHTDEQGYFLWSHLWDLLIERLCLDYIKLLRDLESNTGPNTIIMEFARGAQHGGFRRAFDHISSEVAKQAAILYVNVSWQESLRKNRRRFNPERPDSILEHGLPDEKLEFLYKESDWDDLEKVNNHISIAGFKVPYYVFENEDDVTSARGVALGNRLEQTLGELMKVCQSRP